MAGSQLPTSDSTFLHIHLLFICQKCCNLKGVYGAMFHVGCFLHKITRPSDWFICLCNPNTNHRFNISTLPAISMRNTFPALPRLSPTPNQTRISHFIITKCNQGYTCENKFNLHTDTIREIEIDCVTHSAFSRTCIKSHIWWVICAPIFN